MIHHATLKKAEKNGVVLTEDEDGTIRGHWPKLNRHFEGTSAKAVLIAALIQQRLGEDYKHIAANPVDDETIGFTLEGQDDPFHEASIEDNIEDIFVDVLEAAADAGAELDSEDGEDETEAGSIVKGKYKQLYAERGDATNCGDWLALTLNHWCHVTPEGKKKGKFSLDRFSILLTANGVNPDNTKWGVNRSKGWEGRYRMSGRRELVSHIVEQGYLLVPAELTGEADEQAIPPKGEVLRF